MNLARIRKAVNKIAPSVTVEEWRGCVRLTGECDDWATIYKCGVAAVDKHSLGVLNDVKLKGFHEEPKNRRSKTMQSTVKDLTFSSSAAVSRDVRC